MALIPIANPAHDPQVENGEQALQSELFEEYVDLSMVSGQSSIAQQGIEEQTKTKIARMEIRIFTR